MRSLCIMVMLCGISNGAWAQSDWSDFFQLDNPGENGSDNPYLIENWDDFANNVSSISTSDVYFKLNTDVTIDEGWSPISGFDGYFDGNSYTVSLPPCNILSLPTIFENESDNPNISNISYSYSDIIINDIAGLQELSENVSSWTEISISYTIDLTTGDIEIDGDNWTPIDDSSSSFSITSKTAPDKPHFVVFTFSEPLAADDMNDTNVRLLYSESNINTEYCRYSELTIEDDDDFEALDDNEYLLEAALKLTLCYDVKLNELVEDVDFPLSYSGEFNQSSCTVTLPPLTVNDTNVPKLFGDSYTGTPVDYTSGGLLITDATDLETFANNQAYWLTICKDITIGEESSQPSIELSNFIPTISEDFNIKDNTSSFTVGTYSSPIDIVGYKPVFENSTDEENIVDYYYLEITSPAGIEELTNNTFGSNADITLNSSYSPFDLTGITLGPNTTSTVHVYDNVTFYVPESWSSEPFSKSEGGEITTYHSPSCFLLDKLYNGALFDSSIRRSDYSNDQAFATEVATHAGSGTQSSPYLIYNYEMLKKFVEIVNAQGEDYTSEMYIQLASDINAQGNERLTDINGIASNTTPTLQFTNFKGYFNGNNHTIGGLTCPLFANLNGATIENLGIVDCKMAGHALAASAKNSTVTMSYVSGVSLGLISETNNTVTNCYAYNTSTKATTPYNITAGTTTRDASDTHDILVGNCYTLSPIGGGDDIKTDCTLFDPKNNNIYTYEAAPAENFSYENYLKYICFTDFYVENPLKSNANMLHNVLYINSGLQNNYSSPEDFISYQTPKLNYLYSWYIVDKQPMHLASFTVSDMLGAKLNNIYYSRGSGAYDGLNTIYLPFAWNPATDLYDANNEKITNAEVYILADKLNSSDEFSDNAYYKDYSTEKSLLFFQPTNSDFSKVSNALPTILNIPSGKSGWYIKRSGDAYYARFFGDVSGVPNLYNRYWEDSSISDWSVRNEDELRKGRSFMEIGRLGEDWSGSSDQSSYTYSYYHNLDEISSCDYQEQVTEMNRNEKEVYDSSNYQEVTIYKAYESNAIAVDGGTYPIKIYEADESFNKAYDDNSNEIVLYKTTNDDRIVLDDWGAPCILYTNGKDEKVEINLSSNTIGVYTLDGNGEYTYSHEKNIVFEDVYGRINSGITFYVCGGHEDEYWYNQSGASDFPGRAYHLGTFSGLVAGTFDGGKIASNSYYSGYKLNSAGTGFAKVTSGSTVQPFRTFFAIAKGVGDIDTGTPNLAKTAYKLGFCGIYDGSKDDQTTKIDGVPTKGIHLMTTNESKVYSIDGRYIGQYGNKNLAPGMYIMNGKKFVVK